MTQALADALYRLVVDSEAIEERVTGTTAEYEQVQATLLLVKAMVCVARAIGESCR